MDLITRRIRNAYSGSSRAEDDGDMRQQVEQRIPLRMLGKKFSSKRLLVSSKVFMHTIPTEDCDIVLTLPASASDNTLMWLLSRLRSRVPYISVHFRHHDNSGIYGLYMTASYESLLQGAEELGLRKPLKHELGGGMKEFVFEDQDCFEGVLEQRAFLTSQERQCIIYHMLSNLRATEGEELEKIRFLDGQPIVPKLVSRNIVSDVFPLHTQPELIELRHIWVRDFISPQPLDKITDYFGVKIGLYFAYLGHYTSWLMLPAVFGVIVWLLQGTNQCLEDICWVVFSIFNVLWGTLYLKHWKRTSARLAYSWGTFDKKDDLIKDPRPLYKGDLQISPVTGQMEPYYPPWKRNLFRYCVSGPVIICCLLVVFYVMLLIFQLQEWVNNVIVGDDIPAFIHFLPKVLMALVISVLDEVYKQVAVWLNNKENHRLEETHETNLVIKLVLFQFANSFLSLFYIAFYLKDMDRLRDTLAALLITRQIMGNFKEILLPLFKWKGRLYSVGYRMAGQMSNSTLDREVKQVTQVYRRKLYTDRKRTLQFDNLSSSSHDINSTKDSASKQIVEASAATKEKKKGASESIETVDPLTDTGALTQAEVESVMMDYDDAFEDYLEMCIQFGYVTLFSSAFPLAAFCALLNNLIEIRSDAFKLCYTHKRPFGSRVEDIGIWQDVLNVMVVIAVIVNSALIGIGDLVHRMVPGLSDSLTIVLIVCVEHVILLMKIGLEYAIPDVPHEVALQMAKVEYQRREALKRIEAASSSAGRSQRLADLPGPSSSPNSPGLPRRSPQSPSTSPVNYSHHSLAGHRPQNFNSSYEEEKSKSIDPWDKGSGSKISTATKLSFTSATKGSSQPRDGSHSRQPPSLPSYEPFRNPIESEVQQLFRHTDKAQIKRNASSGTAPTGERASPEKGARPELNEVKHSDYNATKDTVRHRAAPSAAYKQTTTHTAVSNIPKDTHAVGARATFHRADTSYSESPFTEIIAFKDSAFQRVPSSQRGTFCLSFREQISPHREAVSTRGTTTGTNTAHRNALSHKEADFPPMKESHAHKDTYMHTSTLLAQGQLSPREPKCSNIYSRSHTAHKKAVNQSQSPSQEDRARSEMGAAGLGQAVFQPKTPIIAEHRDIFSPCTNDAINCPGAKTPSVRRKKRDGENAVVTPPPVTVLAGECAVVSPCVYVPIQCICCNRYVLSDSSSCDCSQSSSDLFQ